MLLAIDTSSVSLSCALSEKDRLISEWTAVRKLTHSEQLLPHMDAMMKEAGVKREDITAVAAACGPGSFTGLRIGLATVKMIARIWDVPLIAVDTLEALAWNMAGSQAFICPMTDAQKGQVYTAVYGAFDHIWEEEKEQVLGADEAIARAAVHGGPIIFTGESADVYKDRILSAGMKLAPPTQRCSRAGSVAMAAWEKWEQGKTADPEMLIPNYIRRSEAEVLWEQNHQKKTL